MLMATAATRPPGASPFSGTARRAVLEPESRRTCSNARRCSNVSKLRSTTTTTPPNTATLSEANGPVMDTFSRRGLFHVLDQEATEMKATVTVHMKSYLKRLWSDANRWAVLIDLVRTNWLYLELVSSELADPKTLLEHDPVSSWAKHSGELDKEVHIYEVSFTVPASFGPIGAVRVMNEHHSEMLLGDIKVFPAGQESSAVTFHCNSWIQPKSSSPDPRTFFSLKIRGGDARFVFPRRGGDAT